MPAVTFIKKKTKKKHPAHYTVKWSQRKSRVSIQGLWAILLSLWCSVFAKFSVYSFSSKKHNENGAV